MKVSLAPVSGTGTFFSLRNVEITPAIPRANEPVNIKGDIALFGLPYFVLIWIITTVTYPRIITDVLGAPMAHQGVMAWGGHFSIDFPNGFDREGDYKLDVNAYLGPTFEESLGFVTSVSMTIPPFPPVASIPSQTFTVTGQAPTQPVSFQLGDVTINPSISQLGQTVQITIPVKNTGTQSVAVTIKAQVTEMGATSFSPPGSNVGPLMTGTKTVSPGETWSPTFNWISAGAPTGKWLVVGLYDSNSNLTPNTTPNNPNIFKQEFEVTAPSSANVVFSQPLINGTTQANVTAGGTMTIDCPVTLEEVQLPITVSGHVDLYKESGIPQVQGSLIKSLPFSQLTLTPNQIAHIILNTTADTVLGGKQLRVFVTLPGGSIVNSQLFNNAYYVVTAAASATATSLVIPTQASYGQSISALVGFSYQGPAQNLILEVNLGAKSFFGGPFTVESGMTYQAYKQVSASSSQVANSGSIPITIPSGVPTKKYDVLSRILDQNGHELDTRQDSGMISIVAGAVKVSFSVTLTAWTYLLGGAVSWDCFYYDKAAGQFIDAGWRLMDEDAVFNNVGNDGYLAVYLYDGVYMTPQINSSEFHPADGDHWTFWLAMHGQPGDLTKA